MVIDISQHNRQIGKTETMMALVHERNKRGKKTIFSYGDLTAGIATLYRYFPNALVEVVGSSGLVVWERTKK